MCRRYSYFWLAEIAFALFAFLAIGDITQSDEPRFPYQAFALRDGVLVRSGPANEHYATDELEQGQTLEVWRHDEGGWCAIRPPRDSFSLIPQSAVEVTSGGQGKVTEEGLQAWVGTRLGPVENPLWQIKLHEGEELTILGEVSWPSPEGHSLLWYQVAPPDGEFRWVHRDDLQLPDPRTQLPSRDSQRDAGLEKSSNSNLEFKRREFPIRKVAQFEDEFGPQNSPAIHEGMIIDPFGDENDSVEEVQNSSLRGWRRASRPTRLVSADANSQTGRANNPDLSKFETGGSPTRVATRDATNLEISHGTNSNSPSPSGLENLSEKLRQIDMELSLEIIKPAEEWKLSRIVDRLNEAYYGASSQQEKNQASQLLSKVERMRTLQTNLTGRPNLDSDRSATRSANSPPTGNGVASGVEFSTTYDAHGWLNECVQDSGRSPSTYVLQDDNGKIICQIAPSPGLNLHRYLKSKIGVLGQRGFNNKLNLNHVTAERIVVLEKPETNLR